MLNSTKTIVLLRALELLSTADDDTGGHTFLYFCLVKQLSYFVYGPQYQCPYP